MAIANAFAGKRCSFWIGSKFGVVWAISTPELPVWIFGMSAADISPLRDTVLKIRLTGDIPVIGLILGFKVREKFGKKTGFRTGGIIINVQ